MPVLGVETEYGITALAAPELSSALLSAAVVTSYDGAATVASDLDWSDHFPLEDLHNRVLGNGARLYVDHAHPEYATPEVTSARAGLLHDLAGDEVMRRAGQAASEALGTTIRLYKNNTDGKGASYGYHENYLLRRSTPWQRIVDGFTPFVVSRLPLIGAGRVGLGQHGEEAGFQISQRADFFEALVGIETTIRRPLINSRDEPHSTPSRWRRLHVITGDANRSHTSTLLRIGSAAAVLAMLEDGTRLPSLALADPLRALRTVSRDLTCQTPIPLADGRQLTALQLQGEYLDAVVAWGGADPAVVELWHETLQALAQGPEEVADRLDWAAKWQLMQQYRRRSGLEWSAARLAQIDLQYADLDPHTSVYDALVGAGRLRTLATPAEVELAIAEPPADTRAFVRGRLVRDHGASVLAVTWDAITLRTAAGGRVVLAQSEPAPANPSAGLDAALKVISP
ncbi:MAG: proteasome accessory factor PafA2 family protein [Micropruina sp.]|nr:proteasome accessory factor PafA2 family protein [Micropruina sp.]